jgi:hypothetical protein
VLEAHATPCRNHAVMRYLDATAMEPDFCRAPARASPFPTARVRRYPVRAYAATLWPIAKKGRPGRLTSTGPHWRRWRSAGRWRPPLRTLSRVTRPRPSRDIGVRLAVLAVRCTCLSLALAAVLAGCGGSGEARDENKAPEYAATPRKALESWVTAVRGGDVEMMCRLLHPNSRCSGPDEAYIEPKFLRHVRAEMRGLKGDLHYGAIDIGAPESRIVIGVVSGESPVAYAVPVLRGLTQWSIKEEFSFGGFARIVLERPDPGAPLASGRTDIAFSALAWDAGSNYPNAALWIDSRHVDGRLDIHPARPLQPALPREESFGMEPIRWSGAVRLLPGRHVMVAAVKGDGGIARTSAWLLTVR